MKKITVTPREQLEVLKKGVVNLIDEEELLQKLEKSYREQTPLKIKLGADPSRPDLHLGHTIVLNKLREFLNFGHEVTFIIGNFTAMIGDPTGKNKTRPELSYEESRENAKSYQEQVGRVIDTSNVKILYNYDWLSKLEIVDLIKLLSKITLNSLIKREDFANRLKMETPISTHELLYPVMQAYDSLVTSADVEIGGTDQLFNLLLGRDLQRVNGQSSQIVLTMPLLEGTDGKLKMSKSSDNYIGLTESSENMFGKIMSISDELMMKYYTLLLRKNPTASHPMDAKKDLAQMITEIYHGKDNAFLERDKFEKRFSKKEIPSDIQTVEINADVNVIELVKSLNWGNSNSEIRRLLKQNAMKLDGVVVHDEKLSLNPGEYVLRLGKLKIVKLKIV